MAPTKIKDYHLWKKFKEDNDQQVQQELIIQYLPLVKYQAGRIKMLVPGFIEQDDLESYGILGLIDAINKFDYQKGYEFSTYASRRIRGEIIDHLRKLDWLPHSLRRDGRRVKEKLDKMTQFLGRKPTMDELAREMGMDREKLNTLYFKIYSSQWVSLSDQVGDSQVGDLLQGNSQEEPDNIYHQKEKIKILADAIQRLDENERLVISLYYYEEMTQNEIAEIMDLSPARISQLHKKAVYRLRGYLSRKKEQLV